VEVGENRPEKGIQHAWLARRITYHFAREYMYVTTTKLLSPGLIQFPVFRLCRLSQHWEHLKTSSEHIHISKRTDVDIPEGPYRTAAGSLGRSRGSELGFWVVKKILKQAFWEYYRCLTQIQPVIWHPGLQHGEGYVQVTVELFAFPYCWETWVMSISKKDQNLLGLIRSNIVNKPL